MSLKEKVVPLLCKLRGLGHILSEVIWLTNDYEIGKQQSPVLYRLHAAIIQFYTDYTQLSSRNTKEHIDPRHTVRLAVRLHS